MDLGQLNRSFKYGDAVFETLRVQNSKPFNIGFHQNRMEFGLAALKIKCEFSLAEIAKNSGLENGFLRVQVSRGGAGRGYLPLANDGVVTAEIVQGLSPVKNSASLFISSTPQNLLVKAKTANSLHYILAMLEAAENNCDNSLILDAAGNICECASGNIFWFSGGELFTPSLELNFIPGSVQNRILATQKVTQGKFSIDALKNADEVFMTNVNVIVLPFLEIPQLSKKYKIEKSAAIKKLIENEMA